MAIDQKPKTEAEKPKPLVFRDNPEVKKKIEAHKKANPDDVVYYTRLVKEHPERAIETFLYRDQQKHESEMGSSKSSSRRPARSTARRARRPRPASTATSTASAPISRTRRL